MAVKYKARKSIIDVVFLGGFFITAIGIALMCFSAQSRFYLLIGIACFFAGILIVLLQVAMQRAFTVEITEEYCIIKRGILTKTTKEVSIKNIVSVKQTQSFLGRIFNFGDLTFDIVGSSPVFLPHIADPYKLREYLDEAMKKAKI